jgi:hypothetical protein
MNLISSFKQVMKALASPFSTRVRGIRQISWWFAWGLLAVALAGAQGQREVPKPVADLAARLRANMGEALSVAELLRPIRREVSALMRYHEPAAKSWHLDPVIAQQLGDQELFDYVVSRARSALAGGCELLNRQDLNTVDAEAIEKSKIREKYWEDKSQGDCYISADCMFLTDSQGRPIVLRKRSDIEDYLKLQKKFRLNRYEALAASRIWETTIFRSNLAYLNREYGAALEEAPELAKALRLPANGRVYAVPLVNLTYYIQYVEGQPAKVVFVSPLTW